MPRSFPDSGVLIDAARALRPERARTALYYLGDPTRTYLTSPFVRLETVPKAEEGALRASGFPIGPQDVLIAGTALAHEASLVTHNVPNSGASAV